ncbi:hypothetical protein ACQPX6_00555 [Actinomycetospora sp. CA-101289]|uniref:hypothetical protein n=1 Tax=Actinomycetospora sp. CA-101289 TaxID=3239893 RepID=UPI003D971748
MSAVDDLTELVERAGAAERAALASKWKERGDVEALQRRVRHALDDQRDLERRASPGTALTGRWARRREAVLQIDPAGREPAGGDTSASRAHTGLEDAVQAEADAVAAVTVARLALLEAHLAVLDARLARLDAGEAEPEAAAVDGHVPLQGRNAVARHGPALAHGLGGEIRYMLARKPRSILTSLAVGLALGLGYLGFIRIFNWDRGQPYLPYLGLLAISFVIGGSVCLNAMSFDAMRVRAALDSGARLWHLLVVKNLALFCLVTPIGFLLSGLLAWRAGDLGAFFKACALMICLIVLWLGVGNVLSVVVPIRDEPIRNRRRSGTLKPFLVAFTVAYLVGYLVNIMLLLRVFAAQELAQRMGSVVLPAILIVLSSIGMWILLTIFAVALSQQPKIRRALMRELADYSSNAEARALAREAEQASATVPVRPADRPASPTTTGSPG